MTSTPKPGLSEYLTDMHFKATRLSGIMNAVAFLEGEERCDEGKAALIYLAEELAGDLNNALDAVNLPKGNIQ
ncbi:hypothetical protein HUK65_06315 [Rhodobacteraceae bacterium 2376]|uniref:Uncharacterized protein n=1 Tax=Rhabdonatronobacter sediminivivens TaxID=2743469 RepID=A0A7Z0HYE8_9RHOB|nr:hypothetical protein [Rhabdonatronobacter sediminivivens]NYS24601.1 hypothetical protein [Rhabdonatronobacter sediminivivens]